MKNLFIAVLVGSVCSFAQAAIECTGFNATNSRDQLTVTVDGNPLQVFYKTVGAQNNGTTLLVKTLEKNLIQASRSKVAYDPHTGLHGELRLAARGLPRGYNSKFTVRIDPMGRLSSAKDKTEYILSCKGEVPEVYKSYWN